MSYVLPEKKYVSRGITERPFWLISFGLDTNFLWRSKNKMCLVRQEEKADKRKVVEKIMGLGEVRTLPYLPWFFKFIFWALWAIWHCWLFSFWAIFIGPRQVKGFNEPHVWRTSKKPKLLRAVVIDIWQFMTNHTVSYLKFTYILW